MIATTIVEEIQRMLHEGRLSQRKIASRMGVSRGTVNAIALGKRRKQLADKPRRDRGFTPPSGPPRRCPGCGAKVQMPCLRCYIQTRREARGAARLNPRRLPGDKTIAARNCG